MPQRSVCVKTAGVRCAGPRARRRMCGMVDSFRDTQVIETRATRMAEHVHVRIGGYSPPDTSHSRAMVFFKEKMAERLGESVRTDIFWNVMDFGYAAGDLLSMVECGLLGMCYFSTSYLADRVPELEIVDLPFLFEDAAHAHRALDGALGAHLSERIEAQTGYGCLGFWDNGFRHLSNSARDVRTPADCKGLRIRLQPNEAHVRTFALLGAEPVPVELSEGIAMIESGAVNAQENPLSNTATYGVTNHQKHITMSGHFYGARALLVHRESFSAWPAQTREAVRECMAQAIAHQRQAARAGESAIRKKLEGEGVRFTDLNARERAAFAEATEPVRTEAQARLGHTLFDLAARA